VDSAAKRADVALDRGSVACLYWVASTAPI
jgi:hypothetical protein